MGTRTGRSGLQTQIEYTHLNPHMLNDPGALTANSDAQWQTVKVAGPHPTCDYSCEQPHYPAPIQRTLFG
jgi:hypothetical protein